MADCKAAEKRTDNRELGERPQHSTMQRKAMKTIQTICPSTHDKSEWKRMAADAWLNGRTQTADKFKAAGELESYERLPLVDYDALQAEYREWLLWGSGSKTMDAIDGVVKEAQALRKALSLALPCIESAEIGLRADGLTAAADKCVEALQQARKAFGECSECPQAKCSDCPRKPAHKQTI